MPRRLPNWSAKNSVKKVLSLPNTCRVVYCSNFGDCSMICETNLNCREAQLIVGFDAEWPVSYEKGKEDVVAVIQVCTSEKECYVFQVSHMNSFPPMLKQLIEHENFIKVGVNIEADLYKLGRNFGIDALKAIHSCVDLSSLANSVLDRSSCWSLAGLAQYLFETEVSKLPSVRMSRWDSFPLTDKQLEYAALDAFLSLNVYTELVKLRNG